MDAPGSRTHGCEREKERKGRGKEREEWNNGEGGFYGWVRVRTMGCFMGPPETPGSIICVTLGPTRKRSREIVRGKTDGRATSLRTLFAGGKDLPCLFLPLLPLAPSVPFPCFPLPSPSKAVHRKL